jgi:hypothetical protein
MVGDIVSVSPGALFGPAGFTPPVDMMAPYGPGDVVDELFMLVTGFDASNDVIAKLVGFAWKASSGSGSFGASAIPGEGVQLQNFGRGYIWKIRRGANPRVPWQGGVEITP